MKSKYIILSSKSKRTKKASQGNVLKSLARIGHCHSTSLDKSQRETRYEKANPRESLLEAASMPNNYSNLYALHMLIMLQCQTMNKTQTNTPTTCTISISGRSCGSICSIWKCITLEKKNSKQNNHHIYYKTKKHTHIQDCDQFVVRLAAAAV